ncbi:hypothetical protein KKG65_01025 [Patescibacteria group bacterium]|nr:hypothetical protein [Patescibacteria group bacterium]
MLKKLLPSLLTIAFLFLSFLPLLTPSITHATDWSTVLPGEDPVNEDRYDFCRRRQGNQMNLETWYSGKCDPNGNTFSGDQVGFSDIIILDIFERVNGEDDGSTSLVEKLRDLVTFHESIFTPSLNKNIAESANKLKKNNLLSQAATLLGTTLSTPPASSVNYIASVKQNLNNKKIVPEAIAANEGFGFQGFVPVLPVWKAFRNIAYLVFVVFFIVMGFAIMFRAKINSQTVISIQTLLPKIIALLLLITFSYAIVGLMIDLMYVVFYLIINSFTLYEVIRKGVIFDQPIGVLLASGQWGLFGSMIIHQIVALTIIPSAIYAAIFGLPLGITAAIDAMMSVTGIGLIIRLILMFAILYTFFKLFTKLLGAYINIVIQLIFAPIILLGGVFPGSTTIGNWFRNLLANMSVFPTTMTLLLLSFIFMVQPLINLPLIGPLFGILGAGDLVTGSSIGSGLLNAPLIFAWEPGAANVLALIGIGLLLMASKYIDIIKDALKVPPFKHGTALGEALTFGKNTTLWPVKQAANIAIPLAKKKLGLTS